MGPTLQNTCPAPVCHSFVLLYSDWEINTGRTLPLYCKSLPAFVWSASAGTQRSCEGPIEAAHAIYALREVTECYEGHATRLERGQQEGKPCPLSRRKQKTKRLIIMWWEGFQMVLWKRWQGCNLFSCLQLANLVDYVAYLTGLCLTLRTWEACKTVRVAEGIREFTSQCGLQTKGWVGLTGSTVLMFWSRTGSNTVNASPKTGPTGVELPHSCQNNWM